MLSYKAARLSFGVGGIKESGPAPGELGGF